MWILKKSNTLVKRMFRNLTFFLVMSLIDSRVVENDNLIMQMESFNISMQDLRQINGNLCNGMVRNNGKLPRHMICHISFIA